MMSIRRALADGATLELNDPMPGHTAITTHDSEGSVTVVTMQRGDIRQHIEDLALIAGLQQTAPQLGAAAALAGAVRRNFELLAELAKTDPQAADTIAISIAAHLRSWKPRLLTLEVTP